MRRARSHGVLSAAYLPSCVACSQVVHDGGAAAAADSAAATVFYEEGEKEEEEYAWGEDGSDSPDSNDEQDYPEDEPSGGSDEEQEWTY